MCVGGVSLARKWAGSEGRSGGLGQWGNAAHLSGSVDLHLFVQLVTHDEVVRHAQPVWLHGMVRPIVDRADFRVVEVTDTVLGLLRHREWAMQANSPRLFRSLARALLVARFDAPPRAAPGTNSKTFAPSLSIASSALPSVLPLPVEIALCLLRLARENEKIFSTNFPSFAAFFGIIRHETLLKPEKKLIIKCFLQKDAHERPCRAAGSAHLLVLFDVLQEVLLQDRRRRHQDVLVLVIDRVERNRHVLIQEVLFVQDLPHNSREREHSQCQSQFLFVTFFVLLSFGRFFRTLSGFVTSLIERKGEKRKSCC